MNVILQNRSAEHAARLFCESQCADIAAEVLISVSQAAFAIRAAEEGNPLRADELSFCENFSEAISIAPESPLTLSVLERALPAGIESDSDEQHIRFAVQEGFDAELVSAGPAVGLKVSSSEDPQNPILLVHDDLRTYANFVRPGLFANPSVSPEKDALLRILAEANNKLDRWIDGMQMKAVLDASDTEKSYRLCDEQCWTWENWDLFCSDADNAKALSRHVFAAGASKGEVGRALRNLRSSLWLAGEFRSLFAPLVQTFIRR